jgi:general secretion pathway protein D
MEANVHLVSDPYTNSVIVSAGRRYADRIRELIRELDRQPPQVLIQALIAEVTVTDEDVFGASINIKTGRDGDVNSGAGQFRTPNAPDGVFAGTVFGNFLEGTGGLNLSGAGNNLSFFVRALQTQGRLRVLSEPKIMTLNNRPAHIVVGQRVPIVTGSQVSDTGSLTQSVQYEQLGIILEVIPHINPEGFIRLEIRQENSSIDPTRSITISSSTNANGEQTSTSSPVFITRQAETQVSIKDGETIVIGGMISDEVREKHEKVPFFGDLPWVLGMLFSGRVQSTIKTELVIVLTPRVVRTVEDARAMTREQRNRYSLMDDKALYFPEYGNFRRVDQRFGASSATTPAPKAPQPISENPARPRLESELYGPVIPRSAGNGAAAPRTNGTAAPLTVERLGPDPFAVPLNPSGKTPAKDEKGRPK